MRTRLLALLFVVGALGASFLFTADASTPDRKAAGANRAPPQKIIADRDGNRVLDNLDSRLRGQSPDARFDVIVILDEQLTQAAIDRLAAAVGPTTPKHLYRSIDGFATNWTKGQVEAATRRGLVKQVEYDAPVSLFLDTATLWFGVQEARTDFSVDGDADSSTAYSADDIVIAVIDTGIDSTHRDLDGGKVIGWQDFVTPGGTAAAFDDNGHGTHVSSIAAGAGDANPAYRGVAPRAALVGVKVLDGGGSGTVSAVDAGIQWVIDNKDGLGIEVLSMSLGISGCSDGNDSTSAMVNAAATAGIVAVVAAGNEGPWACSVGSPAAAEGAITVGALADPGEGGVYLADFSSRGPTVDNRQKPDVVAPGVAIRAADAGSPSGGGYVDLSGTSMATPFVSGVAALMLDADPTLTPTSLKQKLRDTADDWGVAGCDNDFGCGVIDPFEAVGPASGTYAKDQQLPLHTLLSGSLSGTGEIDWIDIEVASLSKPVAVTMILPDTQPSSDPFYWLFFGCETPDVDIYLYAPGASSGAAPVVYSETCWRQDQFGFQPGALGIYRLKVYSYEGAAAYNIDVSGANAYFETSPPPTPTPTPVADTVTITKASYNAKKHEAMVEATSSDAPSAYLTATLSGGGTCSQASLRMSYSAKRNRYSAKFTDCSGKPTTGTVTSTYFGSASRNF